VKQLTLLAGYSRIGLVILEICLPPKLKLPHQTYNPGYVPWGHAQLFEKPYAKTCLRRTIFKAAIHQTPVLYIAGVAYIPAPPPMPDIDCRRVDSSAMQNIVSVTPSLTLPQPAAAHEPRLGLSIGLRCHVWLLLFPERDGIAIADVVSTTRSTVKI